MDVVYAECYSKCDDGSYMVPLNSFIVTFVAQWTTSDDERSSNVMDIVFVQVDQPLDQEPAFNIPRDALKPFSSVTIVNKTNYNLPDVILLCTSPSILVHGSKRVCVSGLCGILRHILKISKVDSAVNLLGFRKGCLMACAEISVWTKFCEVDLLQSTKEYITKFKQGAHNRLPSDISDFEGHMRHPLRTHNIGKKEHYFVKEFRRLALNSVAPMEDSTLSISSLDVKPMLTLSTGTKSILIHEYAEDTVMTLADLVILICVHHVFQKTEQSLSSLHLALPVVSNWYKKMITDEKVMMAFLECGITPLRQSESERPEKLSKVLIHPILCKSLYKRDVNRYNPSSRIYTKQNDIEAIVDKFQNSSIKPHYSVILRFDNMVPDWNELPEVIHPAFGGMPKNRIQRKCQQLENMANAVCSIATEGNTIVDFCSGGGHLGILLAHLLPRCHIILIENKEASVERAVLRANSLSNTTIIQCNLDYFRGKFDVGVALHACGVATDLVLQRCISIGASFVVCPCCYGGVRDTHLLTYPRSKEFRSLGLHSEEYYFLGHAADQTHENGHKNEQGKYCMGLVDTDRKFIAESAGYHVDLFKMKPENCTPKNNILLGVLLQS